MQQTLLLFAFAIGAIAATPTKTDHFEIAQLDSSVGYIALEPYLKWSNPGHEGSVWMPTPSQVAEADRELRAYIHGEIAAPGKGFPVEPTDPKAVEHLRDQFSGMEKDFDVYTRQFAGAMIHGHKVIICHYSLRPSLDPGTSFVELGPDTKQTFDCRYDPETKRFSKVEFAEAK